MCGGLWAPSAGDLAQNPGMCPDWESNWRPFSLQAGAQSTDPYHPNPCPVLKLKLSFRDTFVKWSSQDSQVYRFHCVAS